jgi:5-methylcytosine-specific restriction endonuclease McrA
MNKAKQERKERKAKDKQWAIQIKHNFDNTCALCFNPKMLNAHHIIPRTIPEFRYDELNGIALCSGCHKWWTNSAHKNSLWFFIQLEKKFPLKLNLLKEKYLKYLDGKEKEIQM